VAPGQNIFSIQRYSPVYGYNEEFGGPWQGTSFSVPLVAGAAALLKSIRPDWSAKDIINSLLKNSDDIQSKNPNFTNELGFGRLNIGKAVENAIVGSQTTYSLPKDIYYFKNNIIFTKQDSDKYFFADTGEASLLTLVAARSFNNKLDEVFALVNRKKYYYVQFFTELGYKWKEVAIPTKDYSTKKIPVGIKVVTIDNQRKVQIEFIEKIVKKGKKTIIKNIFKQYNWLD